MIQSSGVLRKEYSTLWQGNPSQWEGWPRSLEIGNRWATYSEIYKRQLWVGVCVDKLALLHARLPLKVYERDDLNRPEARGHPYAQLLSTPNQRHSRVWFWLWTSSTFDVYGEWFWGKIRDRGGRPVQLVPLHPTSMREKDERDGRLIWDFDNGKVRILDIPNEDLVHVRTYNPESNTRGLSKLEKMRSTLENEDHALRAQSSFWRKGARPGYALSHPGNLSKPAADRLKLQWDEVASGADNTGTTVILEEGMTPEKLSISNEDAQYIDSRRLNREEVVAGYDLPPPAVHILDRATFSNITEQFRSIYRDSCEPRTTWWESELEAQLRASVRPGYSEPDFGDGVYAEFLLDGVLRGSPEQRAETYQKAINSAWMTPAEARSKENLAFVEGSDRLYINSTLIPLPSDAGVADKNRIESLGALVRAGFEPGPSAAALGLPDIPHTGLLPVTIQAEAAAGPGPSVPPEQMRSILGRLGRQSSLAEVDANALVEGLNGSADIVRAALVSAQASGCDLPTFRSRLKALEAPE